MAELKKGVIAVSSPKGGVGRSAVSCLLSLALERQGQSVLLVDLDFCIHTQDFFFGAEDRALFGLGDLLAGRQAEEVLLAVTDGGRVRLCPSVGLDGLPDPQALSALLAGLIEREGFDWVILDLPSSCTGEYAAALSHVVLMVSSTDPTALLGVQSLSQSIPDEKDAYLLINRLPLGDGQRTKQGMRPHEMIDLAQRPLIGILPEDGALSCALAGGRAGGLTGDSLVPALNVVLRLQGEQRLLFEGMRDEKRHRRSLDP